MLNLFHGEFGQVSYRLGCDWEELGYCIEGIVVVFF